MRLDNDPLSMLQDVPCHPTVDNSLTPLPSIAMTTASPSLLSSPAPRDLSSYQFQLGAAFRAVIGSALGTGGLGTGTGEKTDRKNRNRVEAVLTPPNSAISHNY